MAVTSGHDWHKMGKEKVVPPYGKYINFGTELYRKTQSWTAIKLNVTGPNTIKNK